MQEKHGSTQIHTAGMQVWNPPPFSHLGRTGRRDGNAGTSRRLDRSDLLKASLLVLRDEGRHMSCVLFVVCVLQTPEYWDSWCEPPCQDGMYFLRSYKELSTAAIICHLPSREWCLWEAGEIDGLGTKSTYCSCKETKLNLQNPHWAAITTCVCYAWGHPMPVASGGICTHEHKPTQICIIKFKFKNGVGGWPVLQTTKLSNLNEYKGTEEKTSDFR